MKINDAFAQWKENPSQETEAVFGKALIRYVEGVVRKKYDDEEKIQYAEDVIGEAIVEVWRDMPQFNEEKSTFSTWARSVIVNTCKDDSRNRARRGEVGYLEYYQYDDSKFNTEEKIDLKRAIARLSKEDQEIVRLQLEGYTQLEIGKQIGKSEKYVENSWLRRILPKLKELMGVENPDTPEIQ